MAFILPLGIFIAGGAATLTLGAYTYFNLGTQ